MLTIQIYPLEIEEYNNQRRGRKVRKGLLLVIILFILVFSFFAYQYLIPKQPEYPPGMSAIDKAALKADRIQTEELNAVIKALKDNDNGRVVYGDRFMRWTVLAYTLWKIDQGNLTIVDTMKDLMIAYYERAWYPHVKNGPSMPFDALIQYFRADGTWENYWCDYKPVYTAAYMLEYYLLTCFDQDWGTQNYPILKNVSDSLLQMWLPDRHQPCAYMDANKIGNTLYTVKIINKTCSVDSAMIYAALVASAQVAQLANDIEGYENYTRYAEDLITHFYNQTWEWFPTHIFGANPEEAYGTALQIGMTLPFIDGDQKIDELKDYLVENLRASEDSWLLKWTKHDETISPRSVFAVIGLAPKHPELAYNILNAYAEVALSNNPWFLTTNWEIDEYEALDPLWVSGKYLQTYVFLKTRMTLGRIPFSPRLMTGNFTFQTALPSNSAGQTSINSTFPTLSGDIKVETRITEGNLTYIFTGGANQNVTIRFYTSYKPKVSCNADQWAYVDNRNANATTVWFIAEGDIQMKMEDAWR